jgi:hypothetical protein
MTIDFVKCESSTRVKLHHARKQIFQIFRKWNDFVKNLPEKRRSVSSDKSEVFIVDFSFIEWLALSNHHEKNNSNSIDISFFSTVSLMGMLFRTHET